MAKQRSAVSGERARSAGVDSQIGRAFIGLREMLLHGELGRGERISELSLVARLGSFAERPSAWPSNGSPTSACSTSCPRAALPCAASRWRKRSTRSSCAAFSRAWPHDSPPSGCATSRAGRLASRLHADGSARRPHDRYVRDLHGSERVFPRRLHRACEERDGATRTRAGQLCSLSPRPARWCSRRRSCRDADANLMIANDHHRSIVEAIARRQGARAESVAREHA